jgi:single-stranded DNA-binding protein
MIDALIAGRIHRKPSEHTAKNGKRFVTAKVRVSTRDGGALFVNVICFEESATGALLALGDGDSIALSGEATPGVWTAKDGTVRPVLDLLAHAVISPFSVTRKRRAALAAAASPASIELPFDDDLPGAA